jgi:hypothetical protein
MNLASEGNIEKENSGGYFVFKSARIRIGVRGEALLRQHNPF